MLDWLIRVFCPANMNMGFVWFYTGFLLVAPSTIDIAGAVESFEADPDVQAVAGNPLTLTCTRETSHESVFIYKTATKLIGDAAFLTACGVKCTTLLAYERYEIEIDSRLLRFKITELKRTEDERWWTCKSGNAATKQFYLTIYTEPTIISLLSSSCDLAASLCTFNCSTNCMYPTPTFSWYFNEMSSTEESFPTRLGTRNAYNYSSGCDEWEAQVAEVLTLPVHTKFIDNEYHKVRLKCNVTYQPSSRSLSSSFSESLTFAVQVTHVLLIDEPKTLYAADTVIVTENVNKSLRCKPQPLQSRPAPVIKLLIDNNQFEASSGDIIIFQPRNVYHNKLIFCEARNFGKAATSVKPRLYVNVKIKNVFVQPVWNSSISVIENMTEPVVCTTSGGRPGATIKWLEFNSGRDLGPSDSIEHIITDEDLNITKATKNVLVSRQDKRWMITCEAWNTYELDDSKAKNSKSFDILYPPENMGISYADKKVSSSVIEVVRGTNTSLKCTADSNPPVESFIWNTKPHDSVGEILTIDKIIKSQTVQCTAKNTMKSTSGRTKHGSQSISKEINVLYEATVTRFTVLMKANVENGNNFTVNETAFLSIICDVDSNPSSYINLKQSHKLLSECEDSRILEYNISSANCSHNSEYTCQAWNQINTYARVAEEKIQINVRCAPILAEETDSTVIAVQNSSKVLSVSVIAFPMPTHYNWFKNTSSGWQEVTNSSEIQITHAALQFNLTFRKVRKKDYGEYNLTVGNGIGHPSSFLLLLQAHEDTELQSDAGGNGSTAGIIGGVAGGLLVVGMIIAVLFILRRRKSFDGMKVFLFRPKPTASRQDMEQTSQGTQDGGYSYALVDNPRGQNKMNLSHNLNKPAAATKQEEGPCYENPVMSDDSNMKEKPTEKAKTTKTSGKKQPTQSHDGLVYIDIDFEDNKSNDKKKKTLKAAVKPQVSEGVVYDAVQFGVLGEPYREGKHSE